MSDPTPADQAAADLGVALTMLTAAWAPALSNDQITILECGGLRVTVATVRQVLADRDQLRQQLADAQTTLASIRTEHGQLRTALREVLAGGWRRGHPGYEAMQSPWIQAARFQSWQAVLADIPPQDRT